MYPSCSTQQPKSFFFFSVQLCPHRIKALFLFIFLCSSLLLPYFSNSSTRSTRTTTTTDKARHIPIPRAMCSSTTSTVTSNIIIFFSPSFQPSIYPLYTFLFPPSIISHFLAVSLGRWHVRFFLMCSFIHWMEGSSAFSTSPFSSITFSSPTFTVSSLPTKNSNNSTVPFLLYFVVLHYFLIYAMKRNVYT